MMRTRKKPISSPITLLMEAEFSEDYFDSGMLLRAH